MGTIKHPEQDAKLVEDAVRAAEQRLDIEIVTVLLKQADAYPQGAWRLGVGLAFATSLSLYLFVPQLDFLWLLAAQALALGLGHGLALIPTLQRLLLREEELEREFQERASRLFQDSVLGKTPRQNGLLIFASLLEHRIVIVPDPALNARLPKTDPSVWDEAIQQFRKHLAKDANAYSALGAAITQLSEKLSPALPRTDQSSGRNDLGDGIR